MTRADLETLAQRVEREEPSVDIDLAVMGAWTGIANAPSYFMRFTSSLDAAASLMPPGWIIADLSQGEDGWFCHPWREDETMVQGHAPTEPRARAAAALRALAMEMQDE